MKLKFGPDALARFKSPSKIRVRSYDFGDYVELQVLPTKRDSAVNLPKDEQLVDIDEHGVIEVDDRFNDVVVGGSSLFVAQDRKHGWYSLTIVKPTGADAPVVTKLIA